MMKMEIFQMLKNETESIPKTGETIPEITRLLKKLKLINSEEIIWHRFRANKDWHTFRVE